MTTASPAAKYHQLLLATLAVIALPFGLYLLGLSAQHRNHGGGACQSPRWGSISASAIPDSYRSVTAPGSASAPMRRGLNSAQLVFRRHLSAAVLAANRRRRHLDLASASSSCGGRGVYFSLADAGAVGADLHHRLPLDRRDRGEDGLGGLKRGSIGPFSLDNALNYYIVVSVLCLGVLYLLLRLVRSPFGHVLMAIRENQLRATFQGYPVERYKLGVFVISAVATGFAGG